MYEKKSINRIAAKSDQTANSRCNTHRAAGNQPATEPSYTFHSIGENLRKTFGCKVVKLSIDGGFTCPNRDGSKGTGGCIFCSASGSGDMASTIPEQIRLLSDKWPNAKYLAYFQSHTNTYAPVSELRKKFMTALQYPDVVGLAIATRPDCLSPEVLDLLDELNRTTWLWIELGLQTMHDQTAKKINRCYPLSVYDHAISALLSRGIRVVTHLILGLPGESQHQMLESVDYVCAQKIFGIKLHMLNLVKGSQMELLYPDYVSFGSIEEYVDLVIRALERIPPEITIHRVSGDAPRATLIAPEWSYKKRTILNSIHKEMRLRKTWQGKALAEKKI